MRPLNDAERQRIARHKQRRQQQTFSIYKADEGGFGQRLALELLRGEGILCEPATSPYVGQTAVIVYGSKRERKRAERILYSY